MLPSSASELAQVCLQLVEVGAFGNELCGAQLAAVVVILRKRSPKDPNTVVGLAKQLRPVHARPVHVQEGRPSERPL
jgi:hypothetical protein